MKRILYLDNAATTAVLPEVIQAMSQVMSVDFGNPSSRHAMGLAAEQQVLRARQEIASQLGVEPGQLVFTSGGTEANALALRGVLPKKRQGKHLLLSAVEHPSLLQTAARLAEEGVLVEQIPVTPAGWVDPAQVAARLRPETMLVAVMHVNNESGVIQPVEEISRVVHQHRRRQGTPCLLLVDAVQSFTVLPLTLASLGADLLTISAHKIHGPKGVGCLALGQALSLSSLWGGGDQEAGRRPGTENVPGIVGFARAVALAQSGQQERRVPLSEMLLQRVRQRWPMVQVLGETARRSPHLVALAIPGVPSEVLVNALEEQGVFVSSGAACHSRRSLRSHVLEAMAVPAHYGVIRISLSHTTSEEDVAEAAQRINQCLAQLTPIHHHGAR